jgi:quercetin dioxygenase-like cupin family protein
MRTSFLMANCAVALLSVSVSLTIGQVKSGAVPAGPGTPKVIAVNTADLEAFPYDAGQAKFLASSEDTGGGWSLVELTEMPGYHTNFHRHLHTAEAFYVLEGVLSVNLNGKTVDYPAGSYVFIPPGTAHAQGNRGKLPVKVLLTMTPGGFERSFRDRSQLFKTTKPSDPDFRKKRLELAANGSYDVEFIKNWDGLK